MNAKAVSPATSETPRSPAQATAGRVWVILALVIELAVLGLLIAPQSLLMAPGLWWVLMGAHAAAGLACLWALKLMDRRTTNAGPAQDSAAWRLLAMGIAALGPLGAAGGLLAAALKHVFDRRGVAQDPAWLNVIGPADIDQLDNRHDHQGVATDLAARPSVSPFADVMSHGTPKQKQDVVAAIGAHFRPQFARTLKRAMRDAEPSVRMVAAATASRIESEFLDSSISLESDWAHDPENAKRALALAQHYDEYANTGLLDDIRTTETRERALEMYGIAGEHQPSAPHIANAVIRLLVKLNREDEAIQTYRPLMDSGQANATLTSWFLEALFRRRQYTELRHYSAPLLMQARQANLLDDRSLQAAHAWAHGTARPGTDIVPIELDDVVDGEAVMRPPKRVITVPYFAPRTV